MAAELTNAFELTVTSAEIADPSHKWTNSISIWSTAGAPSPTSSIVTNFFDMLQHLQWSDSQVTKAVMRNWSRGPLPLPESAAIWEVEGLGLVGTERAVFDLGDDVPEDGDICLLLHKQQSSTGGRIGKMFLHNFVRRGMIVYRIGAKPAPTSDGLSLIGDVTANIALTLSSSHFGASADPGYVTVHWSAKTPDVAPFKRGLASIVAVRYTEHQLGRTNG